MLHCVWPALHSPVARIATSIISSNTEKRGPRAKAKCVNLYIQEQLYGYYQLYLPLQVRQWVAHMTYDRYCGSIRTAVIE